MKIVIADLHWKGHHTPYVSLLGEYLIENGNEVVFITSKSHQRLDEMPQDDMFRIKKLSIQSSDQDPGESFLSSVVEQKDRTQQIKRILQSTNEVQADVLHLLWFDMTLVPYRVATLLTRNDISVVGTLHRDAFTSPADGGVLSKVTKKISALSLNSVIKHDALDVLTVHSDSIQKRLLEQLDSASRKNIRVIPAPTPDISINSSKEEARQELDLPLDRTILLFFGGLRYEKGPDILGRALENIDREVTVLFAGSAVDFDESDVAEWAESAGDSVEVISRLEFIPESDVDSYFVASDALILPYRRQRGISGPLRRACMAGIPIAGNQNSDIGTIINRYGLGETFTNDSVEDLTQAIRTVTSSDHHYDTALEDYAESQHWRTAGAILERIYQEMTVPQ